MKTVIVNKKLTYKKFIKVLQNYIYNIHGACLISIDDYIYLGYISNCNSKPIAVCGLDLDALYEETLQSKSFSYVFRSIDDIIKEFIDNMLFQLYKEENYCKSKRYLN